MNNLATHEDIQRFKRCIVAWIIGVFTVAALGILLFGVVYG